MNCLRYLILLALAAFCPAATPLRLTLKEAMDIAIQSELQPRLQAIRIEKQLAESGVMQVRALTATQLEAGVSETASRFDLRALGVDLPQISPFVSNVTLPSVVGPFSLLDMRLSARKSLYDAGARGQIAAANSKVETAESAVEQVRQQIAVATAKAYLTVVHAQSLVRVANAGTADGDYLLRFEVERKEQSLVSATEVHRAEIKVLASKQRAAAARADEAVSMLELRAALGLPLDEPLELTSKITFVQRTPTAEEALASALQNRPDVQRVALQRNSLQLASRAIEAQRLPTFTAFGTLAGISTAPTPVRADPASISYVYTAGVSLRIPVLDGGRRAGMLAEVDARRRELANVSRQARRDLELQVRLAVERLRFSDDQVMLAFQQTRLAEEDLIQAKALYQAGEISGVDVAEAQSRRALLDSQYEAAAYQHSLLRLALADATGTVLSAEW